METIDFENWRDLEAHARSEQKRLKVGDQGLYRSLPLFRGQSDASYRLQTTLERSGAFPQTVQEYYRAVMRAQPEMSAFTSMPLPDVEDHVVAQCAGNYDSLSFRTLPYPELLAHLRHHGFPSPLLDWTRSLAVAAFFAYRGASPGKRVAVFMYQEYASGGKGSSSGMAQIKTMGPYIRTHRRHFLQQGEYSFAVKWSGGQQNEWQFTDHEEVFSQVIEGQDLLWKFTAPADERAEVLAYLDEFNVNDYSLFQSEEGLMSTLASRHLKKDTF